MSRNLGSTECNRCGATPMLIEKPRPITHDEAGIYYNDYQGLIIANATCPKCDAKYIAWVDERNVSVFRTTAVRAMFVDPREPDPEIGFFDLSYRSSFGDEPGRRDLPPWTAPIVVSVTVDDARALQEALKLGMQSSSSTEDERKALDRVHQSIADAQHETDE